MEAARTSETSVIVCQTTRRNNREDSHLHTRRRDNLKSPFPLLLGCSIHLRYSSVVYALSILCNPFQEDWKSVIHTGIQRVSILCKFCILNPPSWKKKCHIMHMLRKRYHQHHAHKRSNTQQMVQKYKLISST
jgi:hypothetical protein